MVPTLDPPVEQAQAPPKKKGGGPRTLSGRMRSRANAVKSSLRSKVVFSADMASRILERNSVLEDQFDPQTRYEQMLVADMALAKARIDRSAELLTANEDRAVDRTLNYWEHDQEARALKLKKRLARDPEGIAHALSGFKQGAELLIRDWQGLAVAIETTGDWNEDQRSLALDLLGVSHVLRVGNGLFPPTLDKATLAQTAAREIARLAARKDTWLDEHDEYNQDDTLQGLDHDENATTKRLKRYENMAKRDYDKAFAELTRVRAEGETRSQESEFSEDLRGWDSDSLIKRIKDLNYPPGLDAEMDEMMGLIPRSGAGSSMANEPEVKDSSTAVGLWTRSLFKRETTTAGSQKIPDECPSPAPADDAEVTDESPCEEPATVAPARSFTVPLSIVPPPAPRVEDAQKRPLTRRARKLLEKRLRESAKREAGKKAS
jgi:hypothetical protein